MRGKNEVWGIIQLEYVIIVAILFIGSEHENVPQRK